MTNAITTYRPGFVGRNVFDNFFEDFFGDFPTHLKKTTTGYPVTDIFTDEDGNTVLEFALAGFSKDDINVEVKPEDRSITVTGNINDTPATGRRIARRNFTKTFINYDSNLDLTASMANFENGLLTITVPKTPDTAPVVINIT
jgi:HSP20 family molecular chaperone IbpA